MTESQIRDFNVRFQVIAHQVNTWTGFSGTLFFDPETGTYTLSFRSLEFASISAGGDFIRDGVFASGSEIVGQGFALAQIADAEEFFQRLREGGLLPAGSKFNVTGYSLGGHIAGVFTEAHVLDPDLLGTYIFNAPGHGFG